MKYVLVIDVPEPMESKDVKIDYLCYYHCGNIIENKIDVFPKPLPQKKWHEEGRENECEEWMKNGWNWCLEEITGETE